MPKALYATFEVLPSHEVRMQEMIAELALAVRAEPGCLRFIPYRLAGHPSLYHVEEVYADSAAFAAHMTSVHGRAFNAAIREMVVGGTSKVVFLDPVEPFDKS